MTEKYLKTTYYPNGQMKHNSSFINDSDDNFENVSIVEFTDDSEKPQSIIINNSAGNLFVLYADPDSDFYFQLVDCIDAVASEFRMLEYCLVDGNSWYENGQKECESKNGRRTHWFENGQISSDHGLNETNLWNRDGQQRYKRKNNVETLWGDKDNKVCEIDHNKNILTCWYTSGEKLVEIRSVKEFRTYEYSAYFPTNKDVDPIYGFKSWYPNGQISTTVELVESNNVSLEKSNNRLLEMSEMFNNWLWILFSLPIIIYLLYFS